MMDKSTSLFDFSMEKTAANKMQKIHAAVSNITRNLKGKKGKKIIEVIKSLPAGEAKKPGAIMRALKWTFRDVTPRTLGKASVNIAKAPFRAVDALGKGAINVAGFPGRMRRGLRKMMLEAKGYTPKEIERILSMSEAAKMTKGASEETQAEKDRRMYLGKATSNVMPFSSIYGAGKAILGKDSDEKRIGREYLKSAIGGTGLSIAGGGLGSIAYFVKNKKAIEALGEAATSNPNLAEKLMKHVDKAGKWSRIGALIGAGGLAALNLREAFKDDSDKSTKTATAKPQSHTPAEIASAKKYMTPAAFDRWHGKGSASVRVGTKALNVHRVRAKAGGSNVVKPGGEAAMLRALRASKKFKSDRSTKRFNANVEAARKSLDSLYGKASKSEAGRYVSDAYSQARRSKAGRQAAGVYKDVTNSSEFKRAKGTAAELLNIFKRKINE